jgi:hypothetical protein
MRNDNLIRSGGDNTLDRADESNELFDYMP